MFKPYGCLCSNLPLMYPILVYQLTLKNNCLQRVDKRWTKGGRKRIMGLVIQGGFFDMNLGKETEQKEYKETTGELSAAIDDICAILNKHREGVLYFGVKDNGDVIGFQTGKNTEDDISRKINDCIDPKIYPVIEELTVEGKNVVKVSFKGNYPPYSSKGRHYIRVSDDSRLMSEQELVNFIRNMDYSFNWENQITSYTFDDIDEEALKKFYNKAKETGRLEFQYYDRDSLIRYLGLGEDGFFNKAGYYLFGKDANLNLKMSVFATENKTTFLDLKQKKDNIFNLVDMALNYIYQNIRWKADIGASRTDIPEIPERAIREIVVNSFAHAQYESITEHEINIFPDRIEIYNPGTFPANLTPLDFVRENRRSIIRNRLIFDVLFRSKDVEKGGSGFQRVYSSCEENGTKCDYILDEYGFGFVFFRKSESAIDSRLSDLVEELDYVSKQVLNIIKSNPRAKKAEIAREIEKSEKTVQRALMTLQRTGLIERKGNYVSGYWIVK